MTEYTRLCKDINDFGQLIDINIYNNPTELSKILHDRLDTSWYKSLFNYTEEAKKYVTENKGSIAGFRGEVYTNKLVFDFDSKDDIEAARKDSVELLARLQKEYPQIEESVQCFFSGAKGVHIEVNTNSRFTPAEAKNICSGLAEGLKTFDTVIYNTNRIYRINNTKHKSTGLFKIELEPVELTELSIEGIKKLAEAPRNLDFTPTPIKDTSFLNKYKTIKKVAPKPVIIDDDSSSIRGLDSIDFKNCPKSTPRCIYALTHGIMVPNSVDPSFGGRSKIFFRLATYYRNQGLNREVAYSALKGISRLNHELYPEFDPISKDEIWLQHINSVYSPKSLEELSPGGIGSSFDNEFLKKYCDCIKADKNCVFHSKGDTKKAIVKISDVSDSFRVFAQDIDNNTIKTGINFIDDKMRILTGTPTLLVGAPGCGKSTLTFNILENNNKQKLNSMLFSLDMNKNLVYLKLAQKVTRYTQDQILHFFKTRDNVKIQEIKEAIGSVYGRTYFDFSTALSLADIEERVLDTEQKIGEKIKLVAIDYAGRLAGPYSDGYSNSTFNALKSVEVADNTNAALIILSQVSRGIGDASDPLLTKRVAKDSGSWEESCRQQLNIWRENLGQGEKDKYMNVYLAKNTLNQEIEGVLKWDGTKGIIRDLTEEEIIDYNADKMLQDDKPKSRKFFEQ